MDSNQDSSLGKNSESICPELASVHPLGYLLPQLKPLNWYQMIGLGFLTSLLIETCQLVFHFGGFELDNLVKNTMGAGVGWLIYACLNWFHRKNE